MIAKGRGIVLNYIKYGETSIIVRVFCDQIGYQSFIVSGVRSKNSKLRAGNFQPLNLIEWIGYVQEHKSLHRISEVKNLVPLSSIYTDFSKGTIVMFLGEILAKSLQHEPEKNESLFDFVWNSVVELDHLVTGFENFHIHFLINLSAHLGFGIKSHRDIETVQTLDPFLADLLDTYIHGDHTHPIQVKGETRFHLLQLIVGFYSEHIHPLGEIKSLKVLQRVFH